MLFRSGLGAIFALALQFFTTNLPMLRVAAAGALTWILIGGLGFLLSSLMRRDGAVLLVIWLLSWTLRSAAALPPENPMPRWLRVVAWGLPPVDRLDAVRTAFYVGRDAPTGALLHIVGYGLVALVLGIVIVRRRSLVS